jgi:hypothetical protein
MPQGIAVIKAVIKIRKAIHILVIACGLWLAFTNLSESCLNHEYCGMDMDQYFDLATNLLNEKAYCAKFISNMYGVGFQGAATCIPETNRLPGYPIILATLLAVFASPKAILGLNVILLIGAAISIATLNYKLFGYKTAAAITIFFLMLSPIQTWKLVGNADIVAMASIALFLLLLIRQENNAINILLICIVTITGVFLRQNTLLFFFPVLIMMYFWTRKRFFLIPLAVTIAVLAFWIIHVNQVAGRPTLSTLSGSQLFVEHVLPSQSPDTEWFLNNGPTRETIHRIKYEGFDINHAWAQTDLDLNNRAWKFIHDHPVLTMSRFYRGWGYALDIRLAYFKSAKHIISTLFNLAIVVGILSIFLKSKPSHITSTKNSSEFIVISTAIATLTYLIPSVFYHGTAIPDGRISVPILPAYLLLVGHLFSLFWQVFRHRTIQLANTSAS